MDLQGRELKFTLAGNDVQLLQTELTQIGLPVPDAERKNANFGEGTQKAVAQFQKDYGLQPTGEVDAETARAINSVVKAMTFIVEGRVASRQRAGVDGLKVEIVDKSVGEDIHLAESTTSDDGGYRVTFSVADLQKRGKQRPDLQARALAGETLLGVSDVRYDASNREILNVGLTAAVSSSLPSEHTTLTGTLAAHFKGSLRDLKETDDRQDITYLANKTGWDARAVALAALADQFSAKTKDAGGVAAIDPPFFYALLRAGIGANEDALYQLDASSAEQIWQQAIAQGVIPSALQTEIPQAAERFQSLAARRALDGPAVAGLSSLKQMLSLSLGDDPVKQKKFADLSPGTRATRPSCGRRCAARSERRRRSGCASTGSSATSLSTTRPLSANCTLRAD